MPLDSIQTFSHGTIAEKYKIRKNYKNRNRISSSCTGIIIIIIIIQIMIFRFAGTVSWCHLEATRLETIKSSCGWVRQYNIIYFFFVSRTGQRHLPKTRRCKTKSSGSFTVFHVARESNRRRWNSYCESPVIRRRRPVGNGHGGTWLTRIRKNRIPRESRIRRESIRHELGIDDRKLHRPKRLVYPANNSAIVVTTRRRVVNRRCIWS